MTHDTEKRTVCCAICGEIQYKSILDRKHKMNKSYLDISTNDYGWSDIDYRIEECPHCTYLAEDISKFSYGWHKVKNMKFLDEAADVYNKCAFAMNEMNDVLGEYKYHSMSAWRSKVVGDTENRIKSLWRMYSIYENYKNQYDFTKVSNDTVDNIEMELGIHKENKKCAVCGHISEQKKVNIKPDTKPFYPTQDADFRPIEPFRDSMVLWLEKCPRCGYVDNDISNINSTLLSTIDSKDYLCFQKTVNSNIKNSDIAKKFVLYSLAKKHVGEYEDAFKNLLCAIWIFDDIRAPDYARLYRRRACNIFDEHFDIKKVNVREALQYVDVLRRCCMFEKAIMVCDALPIEPNPIYEKLKIMQSRLAESRDDNKYFIESALHSEE